MRAIPALLFLPLGLTLATACGTKTNPSLCDVATAMQNPACNMSCDASPGAPNTCPLGFHCAPTGKCDAQCDATHPCGNGQTCDLATGTCSGEACTGLACNVTACSAMSKPPTSISGTVFAPNGSLPLFDINVYIPNSDPGAFGTTVTCSNCNTALPGDPIVQTTTDEHGHFSLTGIPDGDNIPVVITIGKWRRQLVIPHVSACTDQPLGATDTTLPKSITDASPMTAVDHATGKPKVDMPKIAISTGSADSLECLARRLGIADSEITTDAGSGHVQLFADLQATGVGVKKFDAGFGGGASFSDSQTKLWGNATNAGTLASYDIVILSCEGEQDADTKPQEAMDHLKAYADLGGRVFLSHWHNVWIEGSTQNTGNGTQKPAVWPAIATFDDNGNDPGDPMIDTIDEINNGKGTSFATWMLDPMVMGSTTRDAIAIQSKTGRNTCVAVDETKGEQWVRLDAANNPSGESGPQMIQFDTPNEMPANARCGKVVFSDMHVSGGPSGTSYPSSCGTTTTLTPQEKALAFMFFDISSCAGAIF